MPYFFLPRSRSYQCSFITLKRCSTAVPDWNWKHILGSAKFRNNCILSSFSVRSIDRSKMRKKDQKVVNDTDLDIERARWPSLWFNSQQVWLDIIGYKPDDFPSVVSAVIVSGGRWLTKTNQKDWELLQWPFINSIRNLRILLCEVHWE